MKSLNRVERRVEKLCYGKIWKRFCSYDIRHGKELQNSGQNSGNLFKFAIVRRMCRFLSSYFSEKCFLILFGIKTNSYFMPKISQKMSIK